MKGMLIDVSSCGVSASVTQARQCTACELLRAKLNWRPAEAWEGAAGDMKTTKRQKAAAATESTPFEMNQSRYEDLKRMLEERRREVLAEVQGKIRDARTEGFAGKSSDVLDAVESSEADIQEDIEFALIQMKAETLNRISEALTRLDDGTYGNCFECGEEISGQRLRALPFAVRCKDCEEAREVAERRERQLTQRGRAAALFSDTSS